MISPELVVDGHFFDDELFFDEGGRSASWRIAVTGDEGREDYLFALPRGGWFKVTMEAEGFRPQVRLHYTVVLPGFPLSRTQRQSHRPDAGRRWR